MSRKKKAPDVIAIDFETKPIQQRPDYPPEPVSFSIQWPADKKPKFHSWGHPAKNNTTKAAAKKEIQRAVDSGLPLLFHHSKFDVEVMLEHMGIKRIPWDRIHDTMFLVYLSDPHAPDLGLKPIAERLLNEPPEERDELVEWLWAHRKELASKHGLGRFTNGRGKQLINSKTEMGAFIAYAPGDLVEAYANGDIRRTLGLWRLLYPEIVERGMLEAYDRERELMPILMQNERHGLRVDMKLLRHDIKLFQAQREKVDAWLRKRLKRPGLNIDSNADFAEALAQNKLVADEDWVINKDGTRSVSKTNFTESMIRDPKVHRAFGYRNRLGTCLKMFMEPWLAQAELMNGFITTNWNQVRQPGGGTRTGRPSTDHHNFLNISKTWDDKEDGYVHPDFLDVIELPLCRRYILPDVGGVFCHRDYNQQELRIMAHFEDGELMLAYQRDLRMDVHDFVKDMIAAVVGREWPRRPVKITNFRKIYGGGAPAIAAGVGCSLAEAKELMAAHEKAIPGVKDLNKQIRALSAAGEPIVTWGGREYYVEPPGWSKKYGRHMTYEYKLLNYLVQGSAADATKQAVINHHNHPKREARFLVTVYDEINMSSPKGRVAEEMAILRESMECLEFDVPLLSDGKTGPNWADLKKFAEGPSKWELN